MAYNEFEQLQSVFNKVAKNAAQFDVNDIVSKTVLRVVNREADAVFNQIDQFYSSEKNQVVTKIGSSKTRVLLIKPVGDHCNLRCTYCYETLRLTKSHEKAMQIAQIESYLKTFLDSDSEITDIFLHGGEPLLAGKEFFHAFIETLKKSQHYGKLTLGIQTNGTLLDNEWVEFLKLHDFRVGISLDGDEEINDKYRIDRKGRGSYREIIKGMELLKKYDIPFGIICVVSAETASVPGNAKRILDHFTSLGVQYVDVHPAFTPEDTSGDSAKDNLSIDLYCRFMTELTEAWSECESPNFRLRCIEDVFENLSSIKSSTCYAAGLCTNILGMDPSGNISPCTRPFHSKYNFGNAGINSLKELEQSNAFQQFVEDEKAGRLKTENCQWSSLCGHGGCPHERFTNGKQDPAGRHIFCSCSSESDYDRGFPGFYKNLTRILKNYLECQKIVQA
jgi:uncharacterized protein